MDTFRQFAARYPEIFGSILNARNNMSASEQELLHLIEGAIEAHLKITEEQADLIAKRLLTRLGISIQPLLPACGLAFPIVPGELTFTPKSTLWDRQGRDWTPTGIGWGLRTACIGHRVSGQALLLDFRHEYEDYLLDKLMGSRGQLVFVAATEEQIGTLAKLPWYLYVNGILYPAICERYLGYFDLESDIRIAHQQQHNLLPFLPLLMPYTRKLLHIRVDSRASPVINESLIDDLKAAKIDLQRREYAYLISSLPDDTLSTALNVNKSVFHFNAVPIAQVRRQRYNFPLQDRSIPSVATTVSIPLPSELERLSFVVGEAGGKATAATIVKNANLPSFIDASLRQELAIQCQIGTTAFYTYDACDGALATTAEGLQKDGIDLAINIDIAPIIPGIGGQTGSYQSNYPDTTSTSVLMEAFMRTMSPTPAILSEILGRYPVLSHTFVLEDAKIQLTRPEKLSPINSWPIDDYRYPSCLPFPDHSVQSASQNAESKASITFSRMLRLSLEQRSKVRLPSYLLNDLANFAAQVAGYRFGGHFYRIIADISPAKELE